MSEEKLLPAKLFNMCQELANGIGELHHQNLQKLDIDWIVNRAVEIIKKKYWDYDMDITVEFFPEEILEQIKKELGEK